jgi:Phospholipase_D-nuclease N-terminal
MVKRTWSDLTGWERVAVVAIGAVEAVLTTTAAVDLIRRPAERVRGPKALWWPAIFVQPVGAPAYLIWGRQERAAALRAR